MKRFALLPFLYLTLAAASCPGPEPWDCEQPAALAARSAGERAPYFRVAGDSAGRYIVTLRAGDAAPADAAAAQAVEARMSAMAQRYGATDVTYYPHLGQFSCALDAGQRRRLQSDPEVLFVEQDGTKSVTPVPAADAESWGLDRIDQRNLPLDGQFDPGGDGTGVHAYVIDTGVDRDHPEFDGRLGEGFNAVGDGIDDDNGHGTHVAGTIAGANYGVARAVVVHPVRVLRQGSGTDSDVIEGIDWATGHALANGWTAVSNMSLGGDTSRSLDTAVCRSLEMGMTHVVAAANDDADACGGSPAHVKQAITVGASARNDRRAFFSNYGQCVDLFAPGVDIKSAWRGGGTRTISGTSMASPHAAGVVALELERQPAATPAELEQRLADNATEGVVGSPRGSPNLLLYARDD